MAVAGSKFLDPSAIPLRRQRNGTMWARLVSITQWLLVFAFLSVIGAIFWPIIQRAQTMQEKRDLIDRKIAEASYQNRILQREFDLIKSNPEYLERTARDTLHLGRPGEVIFRFGPYIRPEDNRSDASTAGP